MLRFPMLKENSPAGKMRLFLIFENYNILSSVRGWYTRVIPLINLISRLVFEEIRD